LERTLRLVVITYTIIMIVALTALPISTHEYTVELYGPLPKEFTGITRILYYDSTGGGEEVILRTSTSNGVVFAMIDSNGTGYYAILNGAVDILSACKSDSNAVLLVKDSQLGAALVLYPKGNIVGLNLGSSPLPIESGDVYCRDTTIVIVLGFADKTYIININLADNPVSRSLVIQGKYLTSSSSGKEIAIAIKYNGSIIISNYDTVSGEFTSSYRVRVEKVYKLLYTDKLYIIGINGTRTIITSPQSNISYVIYYNNISAPEIEVVKAIRHRIVFLSRPPAGWMQIVEMASGRIGVVELMYTRMYSFEEAGDLKGGFFRILGLIYNNSLKTITINKVYLDSHALVGMPETILAAKRTDNIPHIILSNSQYQNTSIKVNDINIKLNETRINITQTHNLELPVKEYRESEDSIKSLLTYTAITLPFTLLAYSASARYLDSKDLSS